MPRLELVTGSKNYSSWPMRPWLLMRQAGTAHAFCALMVMRFVTDAAAGDAA